MNSGIPGVDSTKGKFFMAIKMTERAAKEFKSLCGDRSMPVESTRLRIDTEQSEQEGKVMLALKLDDSNPRPEDTVETTDGAQLVIEKSLCESLGDARLDFRQEKGGFLIERMQ
jgi:Fe-S cluster assembly iron-binding protein IscA